MKRWKRIAAWLVLLVILGMVITTFVFGITGNGHFMSMLILTMAVSIICWVLLWFLRLISGRNGDREEEPKEK